MKQHCDDLEPLIEAIADGSHVLSAQDAAHVASCARCGAGIERARAIENLLAMREMAAPPASFTTTDLRLGGDVAQALEITHQSTLRGSVNYVCASTTHSGDGSKTDDTSVVCCQQFREEMAGNCHDGQEIDVDELPCLVHRQCSEVALHGSPDREEQSLDCTKTLAGGHNFPEEFFGVDCVGSHDFNLDTIRKSQMRRLRLKVTSVAGYQ